MYPFSCSEWKQNNIPHSSPQGKLEGWMLIFSNQMIRQHLKIYLQYRVNIRRKRRNLAFPTIWFHYKINQKKTHKPKAFRFFPKKMGKAHFLFICLCAFDPRNYIWLHIRENNKPKLMTDTLTHWTVIFHHWNLGQFSKSSLYKWAP